MLQFHRLPVLLLLGSAVASVATAAVDFNRDIRPVLSDNCFQCHGPDEKHRMAGLRLDTKEGAFAQTKNGQLIVPEIRPRVCCCSEWRTRRRPAGCLHRCPGGRSSEKQIDTVRRWIARGSEVGNALGVQCRRSVRNCQRSRTPEPFAIRSTISSWRGSNARI